MAACAVGDRRPLPCRPLRPLLIPPLGALWRPHKVGELQIKMPSHQRGECDGADGAERRNYTRSNFILLRWILGRHILTPREIERQKQKPRSITRKGLFSRFIRSIDTDARAYLNRMRSVGVFQDSLKNIFEAQLSHGCCVSNRRLEL